MTKQNILGAMKFIALVLVMLCVSIMFVACGKDDGKGNKDAKEQAQMREVFNSAIDKTLNYDGSYKVVKVQKQMGKYDDEDGNPKTRLVTDSDTMTLDARNNQYAHTEDDDADNVIDEATYVTKSGENPVMYGFEKALREDGVDYRYTTKVSADHASTVYSFAEFLSDEGLGALLYGAKNADRIDVMFMSMGMFETLVDENAKSEIKFVNNNGNYTMTFDYNGLLLGSSSSENNVIQKEYSSAKIKIIVEYTANEVTKYSMENNMTYTTSVWGEKTSEETDYVYSEYSFSKSFDESLMPQSFAEYPAYEDAGYISSTIRFNCGGDYADTDLATGDSIKGAYDSLSASIGLNIKEGLTTDGKWYSDQECTKEVNIETATMPSYGYDLYAKIVPKADYAMVLTKMVEKNGLFDMGENYISIDTKKSTICDLGADYDELVTEMGKDSFKIYVDGSEITGSTFPVKAGETYTMICEIDYPFISKFTVATKEQNAMFKKVISSLDYIKSGKTSYTIDYIYPNDTETVSTTRGTFDKDSLRVISTETIKNTWGNTSTYKKQAEKVGDNYNIYTKSNNDDDFEKDTETVDEFEGIETVIDELPDSSRMFTLSSFIKEFAIDNGLSTYIGGYTGHEIVTTNDTLKITINYTLGSIIFEYKFSGDRLVSITQSTTVKNEYMTKTTTIKTNIAYTYDSAMWEDVSHLNTTVEGGESA